MVTKRREGTSETLLDGRGPDVIRERKRNKMEASWISPTTFIQSFLLEKLLRLKLKIPHRGYLWKEDSENWRRVSSDYGKNNGNLIFV